VNRLFQTAVPSAATGFPPINVYASRDGVAITAELPGISEDELDISVHRDTVTLTGERKDPEGSEGKKYHRRERGGGRFARTLSLPFQVDPEKVDARLENGILRLSLQRPESDKPRRIQLKRG
jgi:HSP20 family protein